MTSRPPADPSGPAAAPRGRFRPLLHVPGIDGYGAWSTFTWDNRGEEQHGTVLLPASATWRQHFAALDDAGASRSDPPPTPVDEADAITACCWRYGSYFHVLTGGERHPAFRTDRSLSRLGDAEMRRINIEFSAALASWLATRAADPDRIARRVGAALAGLPMPWRAGRQPWWDEGLRGAACELAARLQRFVEEHDTTAALISAGDEDPSTVLRREANWAVLQCYRNGLIERFHTGMWSVGTEVPGFARFVPREVERIGRQVSERLAGYLVQRSVLSPEARRVVAAIGTPHDWTLTGETSHVAFLGMPGAGTLDPRLRRLAELYPHHFGGGIGATRYDVQRDCLVE